MYRITSGWELVHEGHECLVVNEPQSGVLVADVMHYSRLLQAFTISRWWVNKGIEKHRSLGRAQSRVKTRKRISQNRCLFCYLDAMPAHPAPMQINKTRKREPRRMPEFSLSSISCLHGEYPRTPRGDCG